MSSACRVWLFAACLGLGCQAARVVAAPNLIVFNADVYTVDADRPRVEAFAVEDGKFSALGSDDEIRALADATTVILDANGKTLTPGFIDAHQHFGGGSNQLNLYVQSREEWARLIRAEHERLPKGAWLIGGSWDHTIIDDVLPTKEFLDEIVGDRPVVLRHIDGHFVWVNSAVLRLAGITADTPVPPGGEIVVDPATREPTGVLKEGAAQLISRAPRPQPTEEESSSRLPAALHWANSLGITGMHNMAGIDDFLDVLENGDLTVRIWHGYFGFRGDTTNLDQRIAQVAEIKESVRKRVEATHKEEVVGPLFKVGFVKLINDGVLSIHTAVLLDDYEDMSGWHGEFSATPEDLKSTVRKLAKAGFQVAIHSIGDAAVRASLDAYEAAADYHVGLPHRIEHVEMLHPDDLPRFAELNVVASMTPNHMTKAVAYIEDRIDPTREDHAYVWRSLLNSGATVILGADSTTSIHQDPLKQMGDAIYRTNHAGFNDKQPWHGEQAITFAEALHAYTLGPAETTEWADQIGSISVGKWADFVIVDRKIPEPADRSLFQASVEATYFSGREVYRRP
jgi:predicted amidohydrolase YtcJ